MLSFLKSCFCIKLIIFKIFEFHVLFSDVTLILYSWDILLVPDALISNVLLDSGFYIRSFYIYVHQDFYYFCSYLLGIDVTGFILLLFEFCPLGQSVM